MHAQTGEYLAWKARYIFLNSIATIKAPDPFPFITFVEDTTYPELWHTFDGDALVVAALFNKQPNADRFTIHNVPARREAVHALVCAGYFVSLTDPIRATVPAKSS